jgi:hypothetical protein
MSTELLKITCGGIQLYELSLIAANPKGFLFPYLRDYDLKTAANMKLYHRDKETALADRYNGTGYIRKELGDAGLYIYKDDLVIFSDDTERGCGDKIEKYIKENDMGTIQSFDHFSGASGNNLRTWLWHFNGKIPTGTTPNV